MKATIQRIAAIFLLGITLVNATPLPQAGGAVAPPSPPVNPDPVAPPPPTPDDPISQEICDLVPDFPGICAPWPEVPPATNPPATNPARRQNVDDEDEDDDAGDHNLKSPGPDSDEMRLS